MKTDNIRILIGAVAILIASAFASFGQPHFNKSLVASIVKSQQNLSSTSPADVEWTNYGNGLSAKRFSQLTEINKSNLTHLERAWVFATGHLTRKNANPKLNKAKTAFEATPLMVDRKLIFCDPLNVVFALDPVTGKKIWSYDPDIDGLVAYSYVCRGISTWRNPIAHAGEMCAREIFVGTTDARLIAIDSETGKACPRFGNQGIVNLKEGLGDVRTGEYYVTSPPTVIKNLVVTGALIKDNFRSDSPSGVIRAFDAQSGKLAWAWDPSPPGYVRPKNESGNWTRATPNAWSNFSGDEENDMIFIPTGNPALDVYGGLRNGLDYYGSSVVALQASTGKYLWHFQTVHHDLWDYDVAAQPTLFTQRTPRGDIPALVEASKVGHIFVLNRKTGEPLFQVIENPVPQSDVPGEKTSLTQPFPVRPPPLYQEAIKTLFHSADCYGAANDLRFDGVFTPPALGNGSITFPGPIGGTDWGGVAVDQQHQIMVVNQTVMPVAVKLIKKTSSFREYADTSEPGGGANLDGAPYAVVRDPLTNLIGIPCVGSPAGEIIAISLVDGSIVWRKPLGSIYGIIEGSPSAGGPLITASGLVFIGASLDSKFRAFDLGTGEILWTDSLNVPATATPMTYSIDGEQYVVIAAGGHAAMHTKEDDKVIAYKLNSKH